MPEGNGIGRLDRIEAILSKVGDRLDKLSISVSIQDQRIADYEERHQREMAELREQIAETNRSLKASGEAVDHRIAGLVLSIGGKAASVAFVLREFASLLGGAQIMWMAKMISMSKRMSREDAALDGNKKHVRFPFFFRREKRTAAGHGTGGTIPDAGLSEAEIQKLRDAAVGNMVRAIAGHDFPGARRYSDEEGRLQKLLREMDKSMESQHPESA